MDEVDTALLGATNLIPGPDSTEMAIHLGLLRAGWPGLILAGTFFILPATLIVLALAWAYAAYSSTPQVAGLLYGVKPVIIAVVLQALWGLLKTAAKSVLLAIVGVTVLGLYLLGANEIVLLEGGLLAMVVKNARRWRAGVGQTTPTLLPLLGLAAPALTTAAVPFSLSALFLPFLKIGQCSMAVATCSWHFCATTSWLVAAGGAVGLVSQLAMRQGLV